MGEPEDRSRYHALMFGVRRSIRYHNKRRMFFDRFSATTSVCSIIFGSATIASVLASAGTPYTVAAAAIVALLSAVDLVVGTATASRTHSDLARRFIELEKSLLPESARTPAVLDDLEAKRLTIEADEPPTMRVLDSICHNELMEAMGYEDQGLFLRIIWIQRLFANIIDICPHTIKRKKVPLSGIQG